MHAKPQPRTQDNMRTTSKPDYVRSIRLPETDAESALDRIKNALGREGFSVVAELDLRDTLRRKLDKDVGPYWVLEICNPNLTDRALAADRKAGFLASYKVAVWQEPKVAVVAALRPEVVAQAAGDEGLTSIAREAERHIERALARVELPETELAPSNEI